MERFKLVWLENKRSPNEDGTGKSPNTNYVFLQKRHETNHNKREELFRPRDERDMETDAGRNGSLGSERVAKKESRGIWDKRTVTIHTILYKCCVLLLQPFDVQNPLNKIPTNTEYQGIVSILRSSRIVYQKGKTRCWLYTCLYLYV